MTTKSDWDFRANYLRQQADFLDHKAANLHAEAAQYRELAGRAIQARERQREDTSNG